MLINNQFFYYISIKIKLKIIVNLIKKILCEGYNFRSLGIIPVGIKSILCHDEHVLSIRVLGSLLKIFVVDQVVKLFLAFIIDDQVSCSLILLTSTTTNSSNLVLGTPMLRMLRIPCLWRLGGRRLVKNTPVIRIKWRLVIETR